MDQSRTPSAIAPETPHLGPAPSHHHPVGLLFTLLRHGRGLSHEEAQRRSAALTGWMSAQVTPTAPRPS